MDLHQRMRWASGIIWRWDATMLRASPHTLLRNEWAPPFAGLSPRMLQ
jgi:hypothetical protein